VSVRAILLAAVTAGCFSYSEMPGERAAPKLRKLSEAKILSMNVNLYKQTGLCPGKEGKLYVDAMVQWPGLQPVKRTLGSDVDSLDPANFKITGPLLTSDKQAHVIPSGDVLASVETGFETDIVYTPESRFSFHQSFPPEYGCFTGWSERGESGGNGGTGGAGSGGDYGQSGLGGGQGDPGNPGAPGRRIQASVTVVSTKFYPKLYAVMVNGTFFLAPADRQLTFDAAGGAGGQGGDGGPGGPGGPQATEDIEKWVDGTKTTVRVGRGGAGNGGNGGNGGPGGQGGNGGTVEVTYDSAFPELRNFIATNVDAGAGGNPGNPGYGGDGGGTDAEENAAQGNPGNPGGTNNAGRPGRNGSASVRAGSVGNQFRNLRGITVLGGGGGGRRR
jgi:hypothetical protein